MLDRFKTLTALPPNQQRTVDLIRESMNLRLESFELYVEGIRAGLLGLFKIMEANNDEQAAQELINKIEAEAKNK